MLLYTVILFLAPIKAMYFLVSLARQQAILDDNLDL